MEMSEMRDIILRHEQSLTRFDGWAVETIRRIENLESTGNILTEIKLTLKELAMGNINFTEKLIELKSSLSQISQDNLMQHNALSSRIKDIEDGPKKKLDSIWLVVITAIISAAVGFAAMTGLSAPACR